MLIPLATLADWLNAQFADAKTVIQAGVALILTVFVFVRVLKSGGALAALIIAALMGGLCYWLVIGGGIADIGRMIDAQSAAGN